MTFIDGGFAWTAARKAIAAFGVAVLVNCSLLTTPAGAGEQASAHTPGRSPGKENINPPDVPTDVARLVAEQLHESRLPLLGRVRILAAVRIGSLYPAEGEMAQQLVTWYEEQPPLRRAQYLAGVLSPTWTPAQRNAFWLAHADEMLGAGAYPDAVSTLQQLPASMDVTSQEKRESLLGLAYLLQSKAPEAVAALERRQGFPNQRRVDHFNFAVSMFEQKRKLEGLALLDELAEMPAGNAEDKAVRDRASMALGWIWLKAGQGGTARASFKRVSLKGPYSNMALLGLGWTELLPSGEPQKIGFKRELTCGDVQNAPGEARMLLFNSYRKCRRSRKGSTFMYYRSFAFEPGETGKQKFAKALVWWRELADRDSADPAVQEAWLAVAYAEAQLGDRDRSAASYKTAVTRYDAEISRLAGLEKGIRSPGANPQTLVEDDKFPRQLLSLRSGRRYGALTRDLRQLDKTDAELSAIDTWLGNEVVGDASRENLIRYMSNESLHEKEAAWELRSQLNAELSELVIADVSATRRRLEQYRLDAVLGLARSHDPRAETR